jgi:glycerol-3-phosphate acyltransferase PlsX
MLKISIDAMGGDFGPKVIVPACDIALSRYDELEILIVGEEKETLPLFLKSDFKGNGRFEFFPATDKIEMDDKPSTALRNKKDSSMRVALDLLKGGDCSACVSAGNTGALMAIARFVLHMLPGIDRPAICSAMPSISNPTYMLDLGANVDSSAEKLIQFAVMGSVLAQTVGRKERPRIALLNVGAEEIKGSEVVKKAASLMESTTLNYVGYAEGNDIFNGKFDVIVCDGFVGNIALKSSEGVARMLSAFAKEAFNRSFVTRLAALFAVPSLNYLKARADPGKYNGASLLGLQKTVVKSHGSADAGSFARAIEVAMEESKAEVPIKISELLKRTLAANEFNNDQSA